VAVSPVKVYGGTLSTTTSAVLNTVPSGKTWIVSSLVIHNKSGAQANCTLAFGGTEFMTATPIAAGATVTYGPNDLRIVLVATETVTGGASAGSALAVRISATETP
jgi:hypothetical protein